MKDKRLLIWIAVGIIAACFAYFFAVTFIGVPKGGQRYADLILGALIGSGFTALISFYYGSSKGSDDKNAMLGGGNDKLLVAGALALITLCPILFAPYANAAPYLVCDPQAGVTHYKITGDNYWTVSVPAQADGSIRSDLAGISSGAHAVSVSACKSDGLWGEQCSAAVPFVFTRPTAPGAPANTALAP